MYRPQLETPGALNKSRRSNDRRRNSCHSTTEQIRSKARELWEQKGRIQGKDLDIWLEAERIIRAGK